MPEILNGFETTSGVSWYKKRDAQGRVYYHKEGEGIIGYEGNASARNAFNGAKKHFNYALQGEGRALPKEMADATSLQELEDLTELPFTKEGFMPAVAKAETASERKRAERNRWWGFYEENEDLYGGDKAEIAKEYLRFRQEITDAEDAQERAIIRRQYNLGGS